ncbi:hypothetical protein Tsubulata_014738 [Turnera subulata]|uniref:Uncharacterized protein n=1 Tax=Turnera subulata TaxID=218843 RepID=A0A9Q0JSF8_9ROSI|nr:hypothetical protein Tsubulata_014738 [Turnera subulata]
MEERKLNFNAPLLSVRRVAATKASLDGAKGKKTENVRLNRGHGTLPSNKLDSSLDQVTEPVAVPFQWEKIPGEAKDGSISKPKVPEDACVPQKTGSGRIFNVLKQRLENKAAEKNKAEVQSLSRAQTKITSANATADALDSLKARLNGGAGLDSDDEDGDMYSDALETLSPTNSLSMNCSMSGVSGLDGPIVKPSGTFATDPLTRDFMMNRFLPAAKAMTLEQPQYASKKQPVPVEQPRQIVKMASVERTPPVRRIEYAIVPSYGLGVDEEESDDEYSECDDSSINIPTKGCSWVPRLCFKNSLCLLNPVPGLKVRAKGSTSSSHESEKRSKAASVRQQSPITRKQSRDPVSKQKLDSGPQSPRLRQVDNKLTTGGSNRFNFAYDGQPMSRTSSPLRRSGAISPYRNEAPQSPFRGRGLLGMPKEAESVRPNKVNLYVRTVSKSQELTPHHGRRQGNPASPAIEKTLYVDSVAERSLYSGPLLIKRCMDSPAEDAKKLPKSRGNKVTAEAETFLQDAKCQTILQGENVLASKVLERGDGNSSRVSDLSHSRDQSDLVEELPDESKALVCISSTTNDNASIDRNPFSNEVDPGNIKSIAVASPLPPVLPKTPSESWLWRTLPSISSHLYRGGSFQNKWQDSKTSSTKWETIVKSSYSHHDHARYSQELIPHASQKSNF